MTATTSAVKPTCKQCGKSWGGMNTCHCTGCHLTFTGITAFDAHRKGGICNLPESVGLEINDRAYECFGYPSDPSKPNHWATEPLHPQEGK